MSNYQLKRQQLLKKLYTKRRLVILNEDSFEETFSLKLNLMNVFVVGSVGAILIIFVTTYIIAFTPLREYIPGYASSKLKQEALEMAIKSDSLEQSVKVNNAYISSIKKVLTGDLEYAKLNKDSIKALGPEGIDEASIAPTENEKILRDQVIKEDKFNVFDSAQPKVGFVLFAPVQGTIIEKYSSKNKHLAVTVALGKNTPIKSIGAGTIIFSDWTPSSGYVVIIRHKDDILSVYKNAASVTKSQGNIVKSGEVIALAGTSTPQKTNATLRFELWKDGFPIDPTQFINFN
jgi:murein DD-endopeptidase MepM/ murein hydrolase activator NlpD